MSPIPNTTKPGCHRNSSIKVTKLEGSSDRIVKSKLYWHQESQIPLALHTRSHIPFLFTFSNQCLIFISCCCYIFAMVKCTYISTESSHVIKIH